MFPFSGGYLMIKFTTSFGMMLAGRILTGVGVGLVC
jgi:predicted MFS family arabinose efflux permease